MRVPPVDDVNCLEPVDVLGIAPVGDVIACPLDEVLELPVCDLGIQCNGVFGCVSWSRVRVAPGTGRWVRASWGSGAGGVFEFGFLQLAVTCATVGFVFLNLTSTYLTTRLSEEERKKCDPVGGRTALLIYPEAQGLLASDPLPFRLLLAGSAFFINLHRLCLALATVYHLLPPTTGFQRLRHLARARGP